MGGAPRRWSSAVPFAVPFAGCRPPLGPETDTAERDPEFIGEKPREIVSFEPGVPTHKVHHQSRFYEDLHAG